jgi:hypothetical protein
VIRGFAVTCGFAVTLGFLDGVSLAVGTTRLLGMNTRLGQIGYTTATVVTATFQAFAVRETEVIKADASTLSHLQLITDSAVPIHGFVFPLN